MPGVHRKRPLYEIPDDEWNAMLDMVIKHGNDWNTISSKLGTKFTPAYVKHKVATACVPTHLNMHTCVGNYRPYAQQTSSFFALRISRGLHISRGEGLLSPWGI